MSTFDLTLPGVTLDALYSALEGFVAERRIKYLPIGVVDVLLNHVMHPNGGYFGLNGKPIHPEDGRVYEVVPVLSNEARLSEKSGCKIFAIASKGGVRVEVFFMRRGSRQIAPVVRNIPPNFASLVGDELATYLKLAFPEQAGAPPKQEPQRQRRYRLDRINHYALLLYAEEKHKKGRDKLIREYGGDIDSFNAYEKLPDTQAKLTELKQRATNTEGEREIAKRLSELRNVKARKSPQR
jgi:hypothetical protein